MLEELRAEVLAANLALASSGLVKLTWGNASGLDPERGLVVIKPTGVPYEQLAAGDLVVVDLDGAVVEGTLRPSSDTPTHLGLYRAFPPGTSSPGGAGSATGDRATGSGKRGSGGRATGIGRSGASGTGARGGGSGIGGRGIGGIVHTHSTFAAAFAQAGRAIPLLGTTHADLSPQPVPVARRLRADEVESSYEGSTADILIEAIGEAGPAEVPAVLAPAHGPFCWGESVTDALEKAITLEEVARIALYTLLLEAEAEALDTVVRDKHWSRKHGPGAYYGQLPRPTAP